jgi:hypothetical protein
MRRRIGIAVRVAVCLVAGLCAGAAARGNHYQITPDRTTMLVGETRDFRMVDENGQGQRGVTWSLSDATAFDSLVGDEFHVRAMHPGDYRFTARTDFAVAEGTIKIIEGNSYPEGTTKWASGSREGCHNVKVIVGPGGRMGGPDFFQETACEDGEYLQAYTAAGVQLWRRKISDHGWTGESSGSGNGYESVGKPLETKKASVCDWVAVGDDKPKIQKILTDRGLNFRGDPGDANVFFVDEENAQCKMWFDEKAVLVKKKKVFVVD